MHHNLEQGVPTVPLPRFSKTAHEALSIHEQPALYNVSASQQTLRRTYQPSPLIWRIALMIGDTFLLLASLAILLTLAPPFSPGPQGIASGPNNLYAKLMWECIAFVSWCVAVNITQAQDHVCASSRFKSPLRTAFALVLMVIFWLILTYPFISGNLPSAIAALLLFLLVVTPVLCVWRIAFAQLMNLPRFLRRGVIVGVNSAGESIARELKSLPRPSANILGYIRSNSEETTLQDDLPVLGDSSTLQRLIQSNAINMIIMAIDYKTNPELFQEAIEATHMGIAVLPMTVAYERATGKIPIEHVADHWYATLTAEHHMSPFYLCWRKAVDVAFGFLGMLLFLLLLPIISVLMHLDSPGPIFYKQERLGYRGRKFIIYKFRSMRADAEHEGHAVWTTPHDARITRLGRFMRATHLDELPQVLNILRGDMSLIGPRPERAEFVSRLERTIPFYNLRLMVKPGLSGWAQVKYHYANTDHDALVKLQYDLYYIKNRTFSVDILIILRTVIEVLACRGM